MPNRRDFLIHSASTTAALGLLPSFAHSEVPPLPDALPAPVEVRLPPADERLDLSPASWIWYPSTRTLPNTVVLFHRVLTLAGTPQKATGWIAAESRYLLTVNGKRIQWGPAPSDPRRMEVDPLDLAGALHEGTNTIAVSVLHYGHGDGTHPIGKPGFIFSLMIEESDGATTRLVSDRQWRSCLATCWRPGQYKRWYVRAFQEEFDARLYPQGWETAVELSADAWLPAMLLDCPASLPPVCSRYPDDLMETSTDRDVCCLLPRSIPLLTESVVSATRLTEAFTIAWQRPAEEYFSMVPPEAYRQSPLADVRESPAGTWHAHITPDRTVALTFESAEQIVGFPEFVIDAPEGTIVELLVHEAHVPGTDALLNTHFNAWARFICRNGQNRFRTFDYESLRWLQLVIRGAEGDVAVSAVGVLRRMFPWPNQPAVAAGEPGLQRLMDACINTLYNSAQETFVDGMGRERQQYSGDGSHQMHAAYLALGETRLPARFISTFSQGQLQDGYFFDCWPAYDRLARIMERQLNMSPWGPLLDHAVGFAFDCYHHFMYTGEQLPLGEPFIRLQRFVAYLHRITGPDGLLPVEHLGVPNVWIDHYAFKHQRHKQCAFNLYAAAMLSHAFAPLARAAGRRDWEDFAAAFAGRLVAATQQKFWSPHDLLFVNNLPWEREEGEQRMCDRSLATAVLFGFCPDDRTEACIRALRECPPAMGLSYPANACWRYWALGEAGSTEVIVDEFRTRWAAMDSVRMNNTLAEIWHARPDSGDLWSHCAIVPLYVTYMSIAGIRPVAPGFAACTITPRPGPLEHLALTAHTVRGPITFRSLGRLGDRTLHLRLPAGVEATLRVDQRETVDLPSSTGDAGRHMASFRLPTENDIVVHLHYT